MNAAVFRVGHECSPSVAPCDFDRLMISGSRPIQGHRLLARPPPCTSVLCMGVFVFGRCFLVVLVVVVLIFLFSLVSFVILLTFPTLVFYLLYSLVSPPVPPHFLILACCFLFLACSSVFFFFKYTFLDFSFFVFSIFFFFSLSCSVYNIVLYLVRHSGARLFGGLLFDSLTLKFDQDAGRVRCDTGDAKKLSPRSPAVAAYIASPLSSGGGKAKVSRPTTW